METFSMWDITLRSLVYGISPFILVYLIFAVLKLLAGTSEVYSDFLKGGSKEVYGAFPIWNFPIWHFFIKLGLLITLINALIKVSYVLIGPYVIVGTMILFIVSILAVLSLMFFIFTIDFSVREFHENFLRLGFKVAYGEFSMRSFFIKLGSSLALALIFGKLSYECMFWIF